MAKLNKFIVEYTEVFKGLKFNIDESKPPRYLIKRFVRIISKEVSDPRYKNMCIYPLEVILVITFLAVLCDCKDWGEIADFGRDYRKWLRKYIPIGDRLPIDDTYRRVIGLLDTNELSKATVSYIVGIFSRIKRLMMAAKNRNSLKSFITKDASYKLINIDGKEARGTGRLYDTPNKINNLHTLNVYDATDGISLFSIPIPAKSNEIPEAQKVLEKMNLKNNIITLDALHAQHKTFDIIIRKHGDYVIGIKGNQGDAFEEINLLATDELLEKLKNKSDNENYIKNENKEYFKIPRSYFSISKGETIDKIPKWSGLRNVICYRKLIEKTGQLKTLYFATSLNDLDLIVEAIIGRWDVENLLHRYLDMDFGEDANKTMDVNAYTNLSIINKLCLSILKLSKPLLENRSMKRIKKSMSRNLSEILSMILNVLDLDQIEKALLEKANLIN